MHAPASSSSRLQLRGIEEAAGEGDGLFGAAQLLLEVSS